MTAQAGTASESIASFRLHLPDVTLMDLRLGNASGIDALISIRSEFPRARIVILTTSEGDVDIQGRCARALRDIYEDRIDGPDFLGDPFRS